ncbi:MAG: hypothetical protein R3190_07400, partial [Thermoanaerobaculia bacterium]|nr:hypothetical protein [Thermoanaerobaculia bacterium]
MSAMTTRVAWGRRLRWASALALVAATAGAVAAQERVIAQTGGGDGLWVLRRSAGSDVVEGAGARSRLPEEVGSYALAAVDGGWLVTGTRDDGQGRHEMALVSGAAGLAVRTRSGPAAIEAIQASPQPVVDGGELVGLVWLEGAGRGELGVRVADHGPGGFSAAQWLSAPGGRSQLAPEVAVLADGSWLVVWSAVLDGDEDIVYSLRQGGAWSAP